MFIDLPEVFSSHCVIQNTEAVILFNPRMINKMVQNYICKRCGCQARDSDFKGFTYPKRNYEILNPIKFLIKISEIFAIRLSCGY